jgi:pimeloyl-ACP methyl ester carboxylesterase
VKRVTVFVVLPLIVLAGCGFAVWQVAEDDGRSGTLGGPATPSPTDDGSPTPSSGRQEAPDPALQTFYDQLLSWEPCGAGNQCADITVPLDYDHPGGKKVELALLRNPADEPDQRAGNLVVNPGGPGSPGTDYAKNADFAFGRPVRDAFDIIGFDPRGTGSSTAVDCLTDAELDDYISTDPDPDTAAEVTELSGWVKRIGAGCASRSGDLAAHVSTVEAARDMDVVRAVLGDDELTYFGASYGTKLGATYAELFPDRAGRLVLDGAVDVSLSGRESSLEQAAGFQTALTAYVDDCLADAPCFLGDDRQAALDRIAEFLDQVDREPLTVGDRQLAVGNAFYGIVAPLYNKDYWDTFLTPGLKDAFEGDGTTLLMLSDFYSSRGPDGSYENNSAEAIYAINCLDDASSLPVRKIPGQFAAFEKASPTFGRVFAWGLAGCAGSRAPVADPIEINGSGAAPILVVGTTRDPATPYTWAQALATQLESAVLLTRDGDGHTGYNMGNDCVDETIESYLIDGDVPTGDKDCGS